MPYLLAILFFGVAILYASVGFGGGSTYNALLIGFGTDYRLVPLLALSCNIAVVSGNVIRYQKAGYLQLRPLLPALLLSIPMAWLGGTIPISEQLFASLLGLALLVTALLMTLQTRERPHSAPRRRHWILIPVGAGCGLLAGLVGIGGGIFLSPVLYLLRWGEEKAIAAACSLFILLNSMAGLTGQITNFPDHDTAFADLLPFWPLLPAVLIGGWIGNRLGVHILPPRLIRIGTAILIFIIAIRLLWNSWGGWLA